MIGVTCSFISKFSVRLLLVFGYVLLAGCASTPVNDEQDPFIKTIVNYESSLGLDHPDSFNNVFYLPDSLREKIRREFTARNSHTNAGDLARWLMSRDGHNMDYQISANLKPYQTYQQRRGNCLSFTLLILELAEELGIDLQVNQVDLPDIWGQGEDNDLVFYRHVNAVFKTSRATQIFDLAMEEYRPGFPQRLITKRQATALLFSNIGIEHLSNRRLKQALHYLRLSASVFPDNADMWINLGAAYKQLGKFDAAEKIYLKALSINDENSLAASNLERLYRHRGNIALASRFEKLASRARARNPYMHFKTAQKLYSQQRYTRAAKAVKRAIKLHKQDPEFFELSSRIKQVRGNHLEALKDLETAHNLSKTIEQRGRYANKVDLVVAKVKQMQLEKAEQDRNGRVVFYNIDSD